MNLTDEVLKALEVLRENAENDFERHRIEVLVKDLTCPPKAEQIDEDHQKFNCTIYLKQNSGHYGSIHRDIWRYYFGEIPEGYEIHHKDLNPANNDIANLEMLTKSEHHKIHATGKLYLKRTFKIYTCENCGKTFKAPNDSKRRFCSYKCRRAKEFELKRKEETRRICKNCSKEFFSAHAMKKSCCDNCRRAYYHEQEKSHIKVCPICGKEFKTRTEKAVCCSLDCVNQYMKKIPKTTYDKVCPICGKNFQGLKLQKYCSPQCTNKAHAQRKKKKKGYSPMKTSLEPSTT